MSIPIAVSGGLRPSAGTDADVDTAAVSLRSVEKSYLGVRALKGVDLDLRAGTITALAGENGAGKSTLIKVLAGATTPDAGHVLIAGRAVPSDPLSVIRAGVSVIYQELTDVPDMSVAENLSLGMMPSRLGFLSKSKARARARAALRRVGLDHVNPDAPVSALSISERQLVEIARCLARNARVLIFDEPTSSLPESEVESLKRVITGLREEGLAILYVSHHLAELFAIADDIVVMRDGEIVASRPTAEWTEPDLVRAMLAKSLERAYPWRERPIGDVVLDTQGLRAPRVHDVAITVRRGEIVGLVGLAGAGRTELMKAISGAEPAVTGTITIDGLPVRTGDMGEARRKGIVYVPEDRKREGIVPESSVADNLIYGNYTLVSSLGWIRRRAVKTFVSARISEFQVKASGPGQLISRLSGGNQQKVILGRFAAAGPRLLILDDPTRGVDVGSKSGIYEKAFDLAEEGAAILITSSDTDEVLAVSDRAYVIKSGRIVAEVVRQNYDREAMLAMASLG
jgi:ABC-type sugar transport system ATPase subunit